VDRFILANIFKKQCKKLEHHPLAHRHARSQALQTFTLTSSLRSSLLTFDQGTSSGHQTGRVLSFPQPGLPRPVEYLSISGMNMRSCACNNQINLQAPQKKSTVVFMFDTRKEVAKISVMILLLVETCKFCFVARNKLVGT